ncbi:hypothetical protein ACPESR_12445 [Nocardia testacea]|uniref:hypothetical protein n=1 Tax=Nocardia testacea TaxID=248551 RepID=UPI003C2D762F
MLLSVATVVTATGAALLLRHRMLRWGATDEEISASYPGDDFIGRPRSRSTMATTLPVPPAAVWPWLIQMGADRAGWYSWDQLDNAGRPSTNEVVEEWQDLRTGDRIPATADGRFFFTVATAEYPSTLVLRSDFTLPDGRPLDPAEPDPRAFARGIWGFHLRELPDNKTRLVVRTVGRDAPRALTAVFDTLFGEPAHLIMQARQFHNLAQRVRSAAASDSSAGSVATVATRPPQATDEADAEPRQSSATAPQGCSGTPTPTPRPTSAITAAPDTGTESRPPADPNRSKK